MGLLSDIFAAKEEILRSSDETLLNTVADTLKKEGLFVQKVRINQQTPKCDGNCAGCAAMQNVDENTPMYKKIGVGCSVDLLNAAGDEEIYAIYVKASEKAKAMSAVEKLS